MSHRTRTGFAFGAAVALAVTALSPAVAQDETSLIYAIDGEISALNNAADDVPTDEANTWLHNGLQAVIGVATLAIGAAIIYEIGINQGLFL